MNLIGFGYGNSDGVIWGGNNCLPHTVHTCLTLHSKTDNQ